MSFLFGCRNVFGAPLSVSDLNLYDMYYTFYLQKLEVDHVRELTVEHATIIEAMKQKHKDEISSIIDHEVLYVR